MEDEAVINGNLFTREHSYSKGEGGTTDGRRLIPIADNSGGTADDGFEILDDDGDF
jgi:hypothetical protein